MYDLHHELNTNQCYKRSAFLKAKVNYIYFNYIQQNFQAFSLLNANKTLGLKIHGSTVSEVYLFSKLTCVEYKGLLCDTDYNTNARYIELTINLFVFLETALPPIIQLHLKMSVANEGNKSCFKFI